MEKTELERLIIHHKQKYYRGETEISDANYDALEEQLRALDPTSYALQVVGYEVGEQKVAHARPMLSLDKRRDIPDVVEWMEGEPCIVTDKMDGSSASLLYEGGVFRLAKTRGDGTYGENLTGHFQHIRIPEILFAPEWRGQDVEIRGELCICRDSFDRLSDEMATRKLERPRSIRNIVAGLLHRKEDLDLCSYLDFFAYEILGDRFRPRSEQDKFELLSREGFRIPRKDLAHDEPSFTAAVNRYESALESSPYLTDGLVIAIDDIEAQLARGFTAHHPKGKLAFKFKSDTANTTVREILLDIGRTGKLTFVGVVDPVTLSGATVQRVTLNNVKYITDHQINVGCTIEITRSGEVIPKHERTLETAGEFAFPADCPICETPLVKSDTEVDLLCPAEDCAAKVKGRIANWISVTGIEDIGGATLDRFFELGLVTCIEDLYRLKPEDISPLDGLGDKSATNLVANIDGTRHLLFDDFLTALGIDGLGPGIAKLIVGTLPDATSLRQATREQLISINGIGDVLAQSILTGMERFGWATLQQLESLGVRVDAAAAKGLRFAGQTFVITGKLSKPRSEIVGFIESNGGKVTGAVSKNTSYLVCNEASSSSKYQKATKLGVTVVSEAELENLGDIQ